MVHSSADVPSAPTIATDDFAVSTVADGGVCGLMPVMPSQWRQTANLLIDPFLTDTVAEPLATASDGQDLLQMQQHNVSAVHVCDDDVGGPSNLRTLVHLPTILIDYWFRSICPMRSTFDSEVNYNRQLAQSMWSTSEAVYYSMQAMSAACLVDCVPQLTKTLPTLKAQATTSIWRGLSLARTSAQPTVSVDLIFAVFSMGTWVRWTALTLGSSRLANYSPFGDCGSSPQIDLYMDILRRH